MGTMSDANSLREEIRQAREAEVKAKTQIYTLRGKKGLQAMAAAMGEELPPQLSSASSGTVYEDPEDSPQIQELRRQIAMIREMERQQHEQINELKKAKVVREGGVAPATPPAAMTSIPRMPSYTQYEETPAVVEEVRAIPMVQAQTTKPVNLPSYASFPSQPEPVAEAPKPAPPSHPEPVAATPAVTPAPSHVDAFQQAESASSPQRSGSSLVRKGGKEKVVMDAPISMVNKVLNASWDSGAAKSKKNNKVYTIQVTINNTTWKIIRGDDALAELSKRLIKEKAEGVPLPPLVKKVVKREQQGELATTVEEYLNKINTQTVFGPKKDTAKQSFLKFFAPFSARDEGMGNFPGGTSDAEAWFLWKLGLGE